MPVMKNTRYIKGKWLNKEYDAVAIRCKGKWVHYMRLDLAVKREVDARRPLQR